MGFMAPDAEYFSIEDIIDWTDGFTCYQCGSVYHDETRINIVNSGDGNIACLECTPAEAGWYGRLSAPGYLDATDWHGPYKTSDEALREVMEFYEVDENGDSHE